MTSIAIRGTSTNPWALAYDTAIKRGAQRTDFLREYLIALYADARALGINADVLVAQTDSKRDPSPPPTGVAMATPAGWPPSMMVPTGGSRSRHRRLRGRM